MTETSFTKEKENIRRQVDAAEFDRISMALRLFKKNNSRNKQKRIKKLIQILRKIKLILKLHSHYHSVMSF